MIKSMKILAFQVREDEVLLFEKAATKYEVEIQMETEALNIDTIEKCKGFQGVTILGMVQIHSEILDRLKELGVSYLSTRTIGYSHIDVEYAKKIGIHVCNVDYPPESVADFTLMMMLLVLRKYKQSVYRQNVNDYSLTGLKGRTMKSLTIGVIGTGQIGRTVIKSLSGFGCKILAYDLYPAKEVEEFATYVKLDELYRDADMITVHAPLMEETKHMINEESLSKMKDGVILINTARGELMDIQTLIKGIEKEKIGALGLDVFEKEKNIYHESRINDIIRNRDMAYLRQFPNVVMTPHMAFYTETSIEGMVNGGVESLVELHRTGSYRKEL